MKRILVALSLIVSFNLLAQEGFPVYNSYLFDNFFSLHDSHAGLSDCGRLRFTGRSQWTGVENSPQTFALNYDQRIGLNSGAGVLVYTDRNGFSERTGISLAYAQHINFENPEVMNHLLSLSASFAMYNFNTRYDKIFIDGTDFDPVAGNPNNFWEYNFNVGASYFYKDFFLSVSAKSLIPFFSNRKEFVESTNLRNYLVTVGNTFKINQNFMYEPSVNFFGYEAYKKRVLDINNKFYINSGSENQFWFALGYRAILQDGFESALLTPMVGAKIKKFRIGYSYDITLNSIKNYFPASHQFSLGFDIFCGQKHRYCNCPYF